MSHLSWQPFSLWQPLSPEGSCKDPPHPLLPLSSYLPLGYADSSGLGASCCGSSLDISEHPALGQASHSPPPRPLVPCLHLRAGPCSVGAGTTASWGLSCRSHPRGAEPLPCPAPWLPFISQLLPKATELLCGAAPSRFHPKLIQRNVVAADP